DIAPFAEKFVFFQNKKLSYLKQLRAFRPAAVNFQLGLALKKGVAIPLKSFLFAYKQVIDNRVICPYPSVTSLKYPFQTRPIQSLLLALDEKKNGRIFLLKLLAIYEPF